MRSLLLFAIFLVSLPFNAAAIELKSHLKAQHIGVELTSIDYPPQFIDKELDSGLPNTVSVYLTITNAKTQPQKLVYAFSVNYQIVYDLWDEVYLLKQVASDGDGISDAKAKRFSNKNALIDYLASFKHPSFYPLKDLADKAQYRIQAQAVVNPIESERIKKIQTWIASSKGFKTQPLDDKSNIQVVSNSPTGSVGARASTNSGPRFQKLFDNILDQYINSDELPALWRSKKVSVDLNIEGKRAFK